MTLTALFIIVAMFVDFVAAAIIADTIFPAQAKSKAQIMDELEANKTNTCFELMLQLHAKPVELTKEQVFQKTMQAALYRAQSKTQAARMEKMNHVVKPNESNISARYIVLVAAPVNGKLTYGALLYTNYVTSNPVTKNFLESKAGKMPLITGNEKVYLGGTYAKDIVFVDYSALAHQGYMGQLFAANFLMNELIIGKYDNKPAVFLYNKNFNRYQVVTILSEMPVTVPASLIKNADGSIKEGFERFGGKESSLNSASQGRQCSIAMFANGTKEQAAKFEKVLNDVNYGELEQCNNSHLQLDAKSLADIVNRLGSKFTAMRLSGAEELHNVLIYMGKDKESDGQININKNYMARVFGNGVFGDYQMRPFTAKVNAAVREAGFMRVYEDARNLNVYTIYADSVTKEEQLAFNKVMNKALRGKMNFITGEGVPEIFKGYTAIRIVYDRQYARAAADIIGDLNAFKDTWTLSKRSHLNIMAVNHDNKRADYCDVYTNVQLWRLIFCAVNKYGNDKVKELFDKLSKKLYTRELDANLSLDQSSGVFAGQEKLNCNFITGVLQLLNKEAWMKYPSVFRKVLRDVVARIEETVNRDRYRHEGGNRVLRVDDAYCAMLKGVLKVTNDYIEVYDPIFERYARKLGLVDRRGFMQKVPDMGTREGWKILFISAEDYISRVTALPVREDWRQAAITSIVNTPAGTVLMPANIDVVAGVAAGLDFDRDKGIFFYPTNDGISIPAVIWDSEWKPRYVNIETPEARKKNVMRDLGGVISSAAFSYYAIMSMGNGNRTVGEVTNAFNVLTMPAWMNWTDGVEIFAAEMYKACFKMGSEGKSKYISQIKREDVVINADGEKMVRETAVADLAKRIEAAAAKAAVTEANVLALADDLDVLARSTQELTIDAQKNDYPVYTKFMDNLRNFSNLILTGVIKFNINYYGNPNWKLVDICSAHGTVGKNAANPIPCAYYKVNSKGQIVVGSSSKKLKKVADDLFVMETANGTKKYILADAYAAIRTEAATYALKNLRIFAEQYIQTVEARESSVTENKMLQADLYTVVPAHVLMQLKNAVGIVYTISSMWSEQQDAMRAKCTSNMMYAYMSKAQRMKAEQDINAYVNQEMNNLIIAADNNIRQIISDNINCIRECSGIDRDFTASDAILLMADSRLSKSSFDLEGILGRCMRPETLKMMCEQAEQHEVVVEVDDDLDELVDGSVVDVFDREIMGTDIAVDLVSGEYKVRVEANKKYLVRDVVDFIEIPEVDNTKMAFKYFTRTKETVEALKSIPAGAEISITLKNMRSSKCHFELTVNGETIDIAISEGLTAEQKANKDIRKKAFETRIASWKRFDNKSGIFSGIITQEINEFGYTNFVIFMDEVK